MMPLIGLHKFADVILGITQKPLYITALGLRLTFGAHFLHDFSMKMFLI